MLRWIMGAVLVWSQVGSTCGRQASARQARAHRVAPRQTRVKLSPARRIHLMTVAKRLAVFRNPLSGYYMDYYTYFNQPKMRLVKTPAPARDPSRFEQLMRHFYKPEKLLEATPLFARQHPFPRAFPWQKPVKSESLFRETDFFRGATINALARLADQRGFLDMATLERELGHNDLERKMLEAIKRPARAQDLASATWDHVYAYVDRTAARKMGHHVGRLIPKMPALTWVRKKFDPQAQSPGPRAAHGRQGKGRLSGIRRMWTKQHLVGNTLGLLSALDIPSERVEVWGKSYSRDPRAVAELQDLGYRVYGDTILRDRALIEKQVAAECKKISDPAQYTKPIFMVLDDGGELIKIVAEVVRRRFPKHAHLFAGVEQTVGGVNLLRKEKLPFAVNLSGTSWAKRKYGNPMFAYAVAQEVPRIIDAYSRILAGRGQAERTVTIRGAGDMGFAIAKEMAARGYQVLVWDKDPDKRRAARRGGLRYGFSVANTEDAAFKFGQYFISATGTDEFKHEDFFRLRPGSVVVNAGSANEFERAGGRSAEPGKNFGLPPLDAEVGPLPSTDLTGRTLLKPHPTHMGEHQATQLNFIKDGGVINFPLNLNHPRAGKLVPGRYIQFQLGLLYLDLLDATEARPAGFYHTSRTRQRELKNYVQRRLAKTGESLLRPKWQASFSPSSDQP